MHLSNVLERHFSSKTTEDFKTFGCAYDCAFIVVHNSKICSHIDLGPYLLYLALNARKSPRRTFPVCCALFSLLFLVLLFRFFPPFPISNSFSFLLFVV